MRPIIYQLFVRHFSNYSTSCVHNGSKNINGCGSFNGVTSLALEKIKELGMTHIWLSGILRHATQTPQPRLSPQPVSIVKGLEGSPYAIIDYYDVDPDLAVDVAQRLVEFKALITRCRQAGLIPIIDFIPNHVSRAYHSQIFPKRDFGIKDNTDVFFARDNNYFYLQLGKESHPNGLTLPVEPQLYRDEVDHVKVTGNNAATWEPSLYDWYETIKLNYGYNYTEGICQEHTLPSVGASPDQVPLTWKRMDEILAYWQEMGIEGFRCDMAHLIPNPFWQWAITRAKQRAKAQNTNCLLIAEAYDDSMKTTADAPHSSLLHAGFDYIYHAPSYHLAHAIYEEGKWANDIDALCNNDSMEFTHAVRYLENHDEPRLGSPLHWTDKGSKVAPALSTLFYNLSGGAVLFYNGQEVGEKALGPGGFGGDNGRTSIFDYTHLPELSRWSYNGHFNGHDSRPEELALRSHYVELGKHYQHPALVHGQYFGLNWFNRCNDEFGKIMSEDMAGHWIYAYLRHDFSSKKTILVAANLHPSWDFPHTHIIIPKEAFSWMHWESHHANFHKINAFSPLTDPYTLEELTESGFTLTLLAGQAQMLEIFEG